MSDSLVKRDEKGRILKGSNSLNPKGRPGYLTSEMQELFREPTEEALEHLLETMRDPKLSRPVRDRAATSICGFGTRLAIVPININMGDGFMTDEQIIESQRKTLRIAEKLVKEGQNVIECESETLESKQC